MAEVGSLYYTFLPYKPSSGAVSDYTKTGTMTIDEMKWTVPGNWYATGGLRLGGKSLSGVDRTIIGQDPMGSAISKIRIAHAGVTSDKIVLNSVTVTTASDADFTQDVTTKTVTEFTVAKNTKDTIDVVPTTEPWAINSYYKVAFNFTNSVNSNYAFVVESILFYAYAEGGGDDPEPTTQDLYLNLNSDWEVATTNFAAYYFNDTENGWSEMMTAVTGETNIYKTTIPVGFSKVIFVRFQSGATTPRWDAYNDEWYVWSQTANLTMEEGKDMFTLTSGGTGKECNGTWSKYTPATPPEDITFYLVNKQGWEAPKAFVFNATASEEDWPGKAMTKTENTVNGFDVYSYTFKDNFTSIIFNNGAATGTIQTADLAWDAAKPYFVPGKVNGEGKFEGTWYASLEAIPAPVYNIAGAFTGWKPYALNVANDKNTATLDVQLPAGEYEFKVVRIEGTDTTWYTKNNGDAGAYGLHREYVGVAGVNEQADNNLKVTADEAGDYLFTWTFANDSVGITFPAKHVLNETWSVDDKTAVAAETQYVDNYAINIKSVYGTTLKENARTFGGFAFSHVIQVRTNGYPSATNLVGAEQSGSTSLVITAKEDVEITMYYNRQVVSGAGTENDNKDIIVVDQAAPTTKLTGAFKIVEILSGNSYLNATKTLSLTKGHVYTVTASGTTLQLSGIRYASDAVKDPEMQIAGAWDIQEENWVVNNMTLAQDKKTATYEVELAKGEYEFKVIKDGAWLTKDNGEAGAFGLHRGYPGVAGIKDDAANNLKVTADVSGAYLFTWTLANDSLNIAFPALPKFCVTGDSALVVDAGLDKAKAWNDEAFMSNADEFVLTGLKADQEYHLQVIVGEAWKGYSNLSEKAAGLKAGGEFGNNIVFKLAEAGDVKVTYKAAEGETPELFKLEGNFYYYQPTLVDLKLVPGVWAEADAKIAAWAWTRKEGAEMVDQWTPFFAPIAEGNDTLSVKIDAAADSIQFIRFNKAVESPVWSDAEDVIWNRLASDSIVKESMTYTITDWAAGTWDVYVPAKFYVTGDSALVTDAGFAGKAWNADAIKSENDTLVLNLKADQDYILKVAVNGTWEGENNVKGYNELSEKTEGLLDIGNDHNIGFRLNAAGEVKVVYIAAEGENPEIFKLIGDFYVAPAPTPTAAVTGSMNNWEGQIPFELAEDEKTATLFVDNMKSGEYDFRMIIGGQERSNGWWFKRDVLGAAGITGNDVNAMKLIADVDGDYTITWFFANDSIHFEFPAPAMFYVTGDSALVKDAAGLEKKDEWNAKAIKAEQDTLVLSLKADQEYKLKLIEDGNWEGNKVYGYDALTQEDKAGLSADNDNNIVFKLNEDGDVKVVYFWEEDTEIGEWKMTFKLIGDFYVEPEIPHTYTVVGPSLPNKWDETSTASDMTLVEGVYTYVLANVELKAGAHEYKIVEDHAWDVAFPQEGNASFSVEKDGIYDVTFTLNKETKAYTAVPELKQEIIIAPTAVLMGLAEVEPWTVGESMEVAEGFKTASITKHFVPSKAEGDTLKFKVVINDAWRSNAYLYHRDFVGAAGITMNIEGEDCDMKVVVDVEGDYTFTWTFENDSIGITFPEKPEPVMDDGYYIIGLNGWNVADLTEGDQLWSTGIETGEFSLDVTLAEGDKFKVVRVEDDAIKTWFPEGDDYTVDAAHAGATTVYFRPNYNGNEDWFAGCIYVVPTSTVDIDNLDTNAPAVKILRDGQILIIKGNKTFNIQGQLVK